MEKCGHVLNLGGFSMANIRKRGKSYQIRVSCGYKVNGVQVVQTRTWTPDEGMTNKQIEKEINRQALLFEDECLKGHVTANIKFETFAERWFEEYAKLNLRGTSFARMKQLTGRVYPAIGHLRLDKITSRHIQQFITDLAFNGKNQKTGKPLARKTIIHHLSLISDVFEYALKMDMLTDNPCRRVTVPKGEAEEKDIYTREEADEIVRLLADEPTKYRVFIVLALCTGFRRGELLGLEWKDIDWENHLIHIRRTSCYTSDKGIYTDTTKTRKSKRILKVQPELIDLLKLYKAEQDQERERVGSKWEDHDRLFIKWDGKPINPGTPYGWFKEFCEKKNIRFCDIHSMRHYNASALIAAGVDIVTVSGLLGHSTVTTTANIYCHAMQEAQAKASAAVASSLDLSAVSGNKKSSLGA